MITVRVTQSDRSMLTLEPLCHRLYKRALQVEPDFSIALTNYANALKDLVSLPSWA